MPKKRILVAPLNWGLGHATRCIPIIQAMLENNFEPVIASDGAALELLKKEFPTLEFHLLPSYNITYSRSGFLFGLKLLSRTPHIIGTITAERKLTAHLVTKANLDGIISDNRWGVRSATIPSVFITHQINVLSGPFTYISSKIHKRFIKKFDECWVPDIEGIPNLSGKMGHPESSKFPVKYMGLLSRFNKNHLPLKFDIIAVLSGPEPQRSIFESILLRELPKCEKSVLIVRGVVEEVVTWEKKGNISICNFLTSKELEFHLNSSKLVVCRPGYTSLMDLAKLGKQAFLIPTPGQYEQEYLATELQKHMIAPSCSQKKFKAGNLKEAGNYKGLGRLFFFGDFSTLFALFQSK